MSDAILQKLDDAVFAFVQGDGSWWLNNCGLIVVGDTVIGVDTCASESRTADFAAAIRSVTPLPMSYLVNTHEHSDHTNGNGIFPTALVIAHEDVRPAMVRRGIPHHPRHFEPFDVGRLTLRPPAIGFSERMTLWAGELRCELISAGQPAHTTADTVVSIPDRSTVFAGDLLFNGVTPLLMGGSVQGTVAVLETVLRPLGAERIVPGHGPVGGTEIIDAVQRYCELVLSIAATGLKRGRSPLETARDAHLGEFADWLDAERLVANLHRAYADLTGIAAGTALDYSGIMDEVLLLRGGGPIKTAV